MKIHFNLNNSAACRDRNAHSRKYVLTNNKEEVTCSQCLKFGIAQAEFSKRIAEELREKFPQFAAVKE